MRAFLRALFCAPRNSFEGVAVMIDLSGAMRRANKLSEAGLGRTAPNPIVGAVILDANGQEIASGFHSSGDHAEIVAIKDAKSRGFTDFSQCLMVVTLEPCNHQGKTGPCSEAIIRAGFKSVAFAVSDPNLVAQGGAVTLRSAGIDVIEGIEKDVVAFTNRAWLKKIKSGRPWILTKIAATLDGKIAASDGTSQWITSENSRRDVAVLRNQSDAIVTTTATVLADNPDLTPRFEYGINPSGRVKNPVRVVMGERDIPTELAVNNDKAETRFINSHDFTSLLEMAQRSGWNQIMIEAGSSFNSALIREGLVDEIVIYQAPALLGAGKNFVTDLGINTLNHRISFNYGEIVKVGSDLRIQLLKEISQDFSLEGAR
jgi:diaminohydroxyphosphoribosylaminopyrimidine deaminase/5-amino-6-(5-phosphoribosylamino)uracil reductase